ncbi:hypothetical protein BJP34_30620 [Moorena producens PAL-8-15-08-1]|uniref:Uncharacterized protein n=1 Tax=Moorena producens PAL-8-15-08-1 TaxID=1458985 RepID=A0A1D8U0L1_9CYAN|nr:hypothetical protein BJP34_30620 [Moorena producens PAL-8-15-08-1]
MGSGLDRLLNLAIGWLDTGHQKPRCRVGSGLDRLLNLAIGWLDTGHQKPRCRVGSGSDRFINLAIGWLDTAHQRINHSSTQTDASSWPRALAKHCPP